MAGMTVIAGVSNAHGYAIACDTMVGEGPALYVDTKLYRIGAYCVGLAGASALNACLPTGGPASPSTIATDFIARAKAAGHGALGEDGLWSIPAGLLIVGPEGVWEVCGSGGLYPHKCGFGAIGSGAQVAIGALHATVGDATIPTGALVELAVEAASRFTTTCGGPTVVKGGW